MGAECSKLRQPMRAIFALSRAQSLFLVVTRSRELSRECHVTKHKTPARSNFPLSNFENSGTIQFSSSSSTSRGLCPKNFEKRAHPTARTVSGRDHETMTHVPRDTHVTKQRMAMRSNFSWSDFKKLGAPELSSSSSTSTALSLKNFEKRAHPTVTIVKWAIV